MRWYLSLDLGCHLTGATSCGGNTGNKMELRKRNLARWLLCCMAAALEALQTVLGFPVVSAHYWEDMLVDF
jgi:hypothetical protein